MMLLCNGGLIKSGLSVGIFYKIVAIFIFLWYNNDVRVWLMSDDSWRHQKASLGEQRGFFYVSTATETCWGCWFYLSPFNHLVIKPASAVPNAMLIVSPITVMMSLINVILFPPFWCQIWEKTTIQIIA